MLLPALALDSDVDNAETINLIEKYFYLQELQPNKLDTDPETLFTPEQQTQYHIAVPLVDKNLKCVITAVVNKDDKSYDKYNKGEAKEYVMQKPPQVSLWSIKFLMPMPSYNLLGYYEVTDIKYTDKGGLRFKLGNFFTFGDKQVDVAGKMRHGEVQNLEYLQALYNRNL